MKISPRVPGTLVPGTNLIYRSPAPRPAGAAGRNAYGRYRCTLCGKEKVIRCGSVRPGHRHTISCGCHGRRQYINRHEQIAAAVFPGTRQTMFRLANCGKGRESRYGLAVRYGTTKAVIDFAIRLHERFLLAAAKHGRKALALLSNFERWWLRRRNQTRHLLGLCRQFGWDATRIFEPVRRMFRRADLESVLTEPDRPDFADVGRFSLHLNALIESDPDLIPQIG